MMPPCARVIVAAVGSGSGKTTFVCALLRAYQRRGLTCASFKCGPDYIDPMFHQFVLGVQGANLDSYFLDRDSVRTLFCRKAEAADISVIEGVMGYYDGLAGISTEASTYEIAGITGSPVILVVDAKKASLSLAAIVKGFLEYRKDSRIGGIVLNRAHSVMAKKLKPAIEELGITYLGWIPEHPAFSLESRHLGLVMPEETVGMQKKVEEMSELLAETVDLDRILELARLAPPLECSYGKIAGVRTGKGPRIGVARDRAFCFYYQENLELLRQSGAELIYFSPLEDRQLPERIDGVILGGGYPEHYGRELSGNGSMREELRTRLSDGLPVLAECGGFLYLHQELCGADGDWYPMVGMIPHRAYGTGRLSRFGYVELECREDLGFISSKERIKGHEFHYWESEDPGSSFLARKPLSEITWECMHGTPGQLMGFPHLYYPSNPEMIGNWLKFCVGRREDMGTC